MVKRILIAEDDATLGQGLSIALKSSDRVIQHVPSINKARAELAQTSFDLLILDINLPDGSGLDLLKEIKQSLPKLSVILLSANDMELDVVAGLELGADDYVTKPFSLAILKARIDTQLRKQETIETALYQYGNLRLDFDRMQFFKDNQRIEFTKTEQKLLKYFVNHPGQVLTREQLIDYVWDDQGQFVDANALSVTIKRLRDKLGQSNWIESVYGIGYKWVVPHD